MRVYLDYAATSPLTNGAREAMLPLLNETFGNPDSLHASGRRAAAYLTDARDLIASVLGVTPSELFFTSGGTESDNWAISMLGEGKAVVSPIEHAAVLSAANRRNGCVFCGVGEDGIVTPAHILPHLEGAGLVAVMAVNNETGCVQPVEELAAAAHSHGALFFSDCVQAACSQNLKQLAAVCDGLSLSAHKVGGPKGTGVLYLKKGTKISPLIVGGEQERGLRGGTSNVAGAVGFAHALAAAAAQREQFCAHTGRLRDLFEKTLLSSAGELIRIDGERRAPNISHITVKGSPSLLNALDLAGVEASGGAACSAHASAPSHVMLAMGRKEEEARGIRFSFALSTTEEECLFAAHTLLSLLGRGE